MNTSKRKVKQRRKSSLRFWIVATFLLSIIYVWLQQKGDTYDIWPRTNVQEAVPITGLHPVVAESEKLLVRKAARRGIEVVITHDFRSIDEQDALYNQGRSLSGNIVTNAKGGESYHNYGLAIDFALRTPEGDVVWDMERDDNGNGKPDWLEVVELAKELGFTWGGDWANFPDYPHLQMDFGLSINDLKRGKRPPDTH
ncbi:M15 family metallopeptidase [Paenibacillus taichungensis]|uniref:M15 family metallopeptidase n=1 Tax=Paenibacillus taichungensis TaxID=484184 RepID=A0ABX2MEN7_9BACL|nr:MULTISPECIES: M15 family metallopeptidase [Paenibacillus]OME85355.1 peptidase M15 [Paenibacillus pabuli]MDR9748237.1 M15 family metallopeptidase [Paenibacillus taichungensis]MEC0109443.1 M15 family metallopeptidase [Paenibacillus taichungensis]MEC0197519.1 M15 family metallopeptidase [Paenibacillus taichungensis]NUU52854.1 M15 family metallopeptidase [Paenibacillus taichungensis]